MYFGPINPSYCMSIGIDSTCFLRLNQKCMLWWFLNLLENVSEIHKHKSSALHFSLIENETSTSSVKIIINPELRKTTQHLSEILNAVSTRLTKMCWLKQKETFPLFLMHTCNPLRKKLKYATCVNMKLQPVFHHHPNFYMPLNQWEKINSQQAVRTGKARWTSRLSLRPYTHSHDKP